MRFDCIPVCDLHHARMRRAGGILPLEYYGCESDKFCTRAYNSLDGYFSMVEGGNPRSSPNNQRLCPEHSAPLLIRVYDPQQQLRRYSCPVETCSYEEEELLLEMSEAPLVSST